MRIARLIGLAILLTGACFTLFAQNPQSTPASASQDTLWVRIKRPLPNIYERLDPKSPIIRQGKRNEYLVVLREGRSGTWLEVEVDGRVGWMETRAGELVTKKGNLELTMILIVIVLMLGCAGCVVLFIKKQQEQITAEEQFD